MNQRSATIPRRKPGEKKEQSQSGSKQLTEHSTSRSLNRPKLEESATKLDGKLRHITITVPKQFVVGAEEMARILGYSEDDLGKVIAEYGWTIADALGDLHSDMEYRTWSDEQECRQVAARVVERLEPGIVVRVGRVGKEWIMRFFHKDHPRLYLWNKCEEHGLDFDEFDRETFHRKSDVRKFVDEKLAAAA